MHKYYSVVLTSTDIDESYSIFYILWIYYKSLSETPKFEMYEKCVVFFVMLTISLSPDSRSAHLHPLQSLEQ